MTRAPLRLRARPRPVRARSHAPEARHGVKQVLLHLVDLPDSPEENLHLRRRAAGAPRGCGASMRTLSVRKGGGETAGGGCLGGRAEAGGAQRAQCQRPPGWPWSRGTCTQRSPLREAAEGTMGGQQRCVRPLARVVAAPQEGRAMAADVRASLEEQDLQSDRRTHQPCTGCWASRGCTSPCRPAAAAPHQGEGQCLSFHTKKEAEAAAAAQISWKKERTAAPSMSARVTPAAMDTTSFLSVRSEDTCRFSTADTREQR